MKEMCVYCDEPTGKAGTCDDSLYCSRCDDGPFCEECILDHVADGEYVECSKRMR